uniref:Uncharacterized protein n=1 Tax=Arundo donax TaxID=35708 RepID=A0A0A9A278_ARUDO
MMMPKVTTSPSSQRRG